MFIRYAGLLQRAFKRRRFGARVQYYPAGCQFNDIADHIATARLSDVQRERMDALADIRQSVNHRDTFDPRRLRVYRNHTVTLRVQEQEAERQAEHLFQALLERAFREQ